MIIDRECAPEQNLPALIHEMKRGAVDKKHPFRYVVLSTYGGGEVSSRYVVLREVYNPLIFIMYTDARSAKYEDIHQHPQAALLLFHASKKLQVRVSGDVKLHGKDEVAAESWKKVQGRGQDAYNTVLPPGTPVDAPDQAAYREPKANTDFCVLSLEASRWEALELGRNEHLRIQYTAHGLGWRGRWLVP